MQFDRLLTEARLATMVAGDDGYGVIEKAALGIKDGRIAWIGPMSEIPGEARETERLARRWVTPALIDCHTHLVFAGDRSDEFERRLGGESYESISRSGGGIAPRNGRGESGRAAGGPACSAPLARRNLGDSTAGADMRRARASAEAGGGPAGGPPAGSGGGPRRHRRRRWRGRPPRG